jgi:hypothetical protein
MSTDPQSVPATAELSSNRALIANAAGWFGLIMLIGNLLYWGVTGNNFDLPAKVLLILGLLAIGTFGLMNPQGIIDIVSGQGTRTILSTVLLLALGFGIIVAINIIYGEIVKRQPSPILRTDLTEGQQNSLSPQSIRAVQELTGTVTAYGFFGTTGDEISQQRDAENLLKEYQKYSNKLKVEFVNPDVALAQANRYGLTRYDVVVFDNGVRHETADSTSEENFTGALLRLRSSTQKTVAILNVPSVLDFSGSSQQALAATLARRGLDTENYTVLPTYNLVVSPTISVTDVDVMIVPPSPENQPLPDNAVRALMDYLDHGGHVLLIGDPLAAPLPAALLQKYGLSEARGIIVDQDRNSLWGNSPTQLLALTYPSSTITRDMNNVPTIYGAAEPIVVATTTITGFTTTPYIQSSSTAQYAVIQADASGNQSQLALDPNGPQAPMNIAVAVEQTVEDTGNFTSTETTKPQVTRLAVIGDYDMLSDQLISQAPGNLDMFNNTVNWLSQSEERISVRPKDTTPRQLTMTEQQQSLIAWSTIVFLPVLVLLGGGLVWWRRR